MIRKFSKVEVFQVPLDTSGSPSSAPLQKFANLQRLTPYDPDSRYVQFVAIGNLEVDGPNMNHDGFPYEYFEDERPGFGYRSFIGKRAHVEHNSDKGLMGSIGELVDAHLNAFTIPPKFAGRRYADLDSFEVPERQEVISTEDQQPGTIEVLMRIDTKLIDSADIPETLRRMAKHAIRVIDSGQKVFCSMGMNLQYSDCSVCGNRAISDEDYCEHLQKRRGGIVGVTANKVRDLLDQRRLRPEWLPHLIKRTADVQEILQGYGNHMVLMKVAEINHEHSFFELSLVGAPAFPKAEMRKVIANQTVASLDWEKFTNEELLTLYENLVA